jgi:putative transposase
MLFDITDGINDGRRNDLTGGGLNRSAGGWSAIREQEGGVHMKSDERILGDGDFVSQTLSTAEEQLELGYELKSRGIDIDYIARRVSQLLDISLEDVWRQGKFKHLVRVRSLLCFWAVRKLGVSMASMGRCVPYILGLRFIDDCCMDCI